jgi:hypothetical protein
MPDALAVITRVISEHHAIRGHVKLAGDSVNDIEALSTLHRTRSGWSQTSIATLIDKRNELQQAVNFLEQGLKNHFGYEEKVLPSLFGELLMKALLYEHHEITRQIESVKILLNSTKMEGLEQPDLLSKKSEILLNINNLCQAVEEHAGHEEIILNMIKRALEQSQD